MRYKVKTYEGIVTHPTHKTCRVVIHRAIGNDNKVAGKLTVKALQEKEPDVGLWPGDTIEYYHVPQGFLLERING